MDRKTKTRRERVLEHLAVLRIPLTAEELDHVVGAAEREQLPLLEAIDRLLGEQAARRRDRGIKRRITAARFAEHKTLETFDWKFNKTINRAQYEQLATGDFIRRHVNIILVGQSGVGKSHVMQAVGLITNVEFDAWAQYLGDAPLAMAMLDRLVDGAVVIKIKGPSYRANRPGDTTP